MLSNEEIKRKILREDGKFQVGDIVIGLPNNGYRVTNYECVCKVVDVLSGGTIRVKVLHHEDYVGDYDGSTHMVEAQGFDFYEDNVFGMHETYHNMLLRGQAPY